jgi:hypothetical protein
MISKKMVIISDIDCFTKFMGIKFINVNTFAINEDRFIINNKYYKPSHFIISVAIMKDNIYGVEFLMDDTRFYLSNLPHGIVFSILEMYHSTTHFYIEEEQGMVYHGVIRIGDKITNEEIKKFAKIYENK